MINKRQHIYWSSIILVAVSIFSGCTKQPGGSLNVTPVAFVSMMNLAPYGNAVDIFFNGVQISPAGGVLPGEFSTEYGQLKPGNYTVDFKVTGTDSLLYELPAAQYDTTAFYTLIIYNTTAGSKAVSATRIQDDFSQVGTVSAYYRFFDMSPDAANVNLLFDGSIAQSNRTPADIISNPAYEQFQSVPPKNYTIEVQNSADSVLATQSNYPFAAGYVYTVFLTGTAQSSFTVNVLPAVF